MVLEDVLCKEYPLWRPKLPSSTPLGAASSMATNEVSATVASKGDNLSQEAVWLRLTCKPTVGISLKGAASFFADDNVDTGLCFIA
jgi:hypothetical protein